MKSKLVSTDAMSDELSRMVELKRRVSNDDPILRFVTPDSIGKSLLRAKYTDRQRLFYVSSDPSIQSRTLALVVARISPAIKDEDGKPVGMLGFFDAVEAFEPAEEVLCAADQWLRENGCESIVGPMDGDTWHKYRFNVGPASDPPFLLEPTNPCYYQELYTKSGFEIVDRYHSLRVDEIGAVLPTLKPAFDLATNAGYRFRPIRLNHFSDELKTIHEISSTAFQDNFLYDDISLNEFLSLYLEAKSLIRPELVWFVEDSNGQEIGFLFCLVDSFRAVAAMKGESGIFAKLRFLWSRSSADAVNFKSIAVLPEHRRAGLGGALMYQGYRESLKLGFSKANLCLIRDGNPSSRLDGGNSRILRRYELYQTPGSRLIGAPTMTELGEHGISESTR